MPRDGVLKVAFLVHDLGGISGGANAIVEHATGLSRLGHEVWLLSTTATEIASTWHPGLSALRVDTVEAVRSVRFDVALATWWETFFRLHRVHAEVHGYFNQSLETRFYADPVRKALCRLTYELPVLFVTEAGWLAELISALQPGAPVLYVRNGLSTNWFPRQREPIPASNRLRVLVEGPWVPEFKNVPRTFELVAEAARQLPLTVGWLTSNSGGQQPSLGTELRIHERIPVAEVAGVLRQYDVLLKLSKVEGMFGPPLEMFSQGGTALVQQVTGADEYIVAGENALVVNTFDDWRVPELLRTLASDGALLERLKRRALGTAACWPDWSEASAELSRKLEQMRSGGFTTRGLVPKLEELARRHAAQQAALAGANPSVGVRGRVKQVSKRLASAVLSRRAGRG